MRQLREEARNQDEDPKDVIVLKDKTIPFEDLEKLPSSVRAFLEAPYISSYVLRFACSRRAKLRF